MKAINAVLIFYVLTATTSASAYYHTSFLAGMDFSFGQDASSDLAFDSGSEASLFTLNIQTGLAEDGVFFFGNQAFNTPGWDALGETVDNVGFPMPVGADANVPANIGLVAGIEPSNYRFGGTSTAALGFFSATTGLSFGENNHGIFSIDIIDTGAPLTDVAINFDSIVTGTQAAGTLFVNGQSVAVGTSAVNTTLLLGDLYPGESIIFELFDLPYGFTLDNVLIYNSFATYPEPSTYTAIASAFALAFATYRRRKQSSDQSSNPKAGSVTGRQSRNQVNVEH